MFKNVILMSMLALFIISCSESTSPSTTTPTTPETSKDKFIVDAKKDGYVLVTGEKANLVGNGSLMNEDNTTVLYEYVGKTNDDKKAIYKKGAGKFFGVTLTGTINANGSDTRELDFYLDKASTSYLAKYWDDTSKVDFTDDENLAKAELRLSMGTPVVVDSDGSASDISFTEYNGNRYILAKGNSGVALYKETGTVWSKLADRSHNSSTKSGSSLQVVGDDFVSVIYKTGTRESEIGIRKNTDTGISSTEQFGLKGIEVGFFDKTISTVVVDNNKVAVAYDNSTWDNKDGGVVLTTTMAGKSPVQVSYNAGYTKPKATVLKRRDGVSVVNLFAIDNSTGTETLKVMIGNTVVVGLTLSGVKAYDVVTTSNLKQNYLIASTADNISIYKSTGSSWKSMAVVVADFEADYIDVAIVDDNFLYILYMENKENDSKALIRKYKILGDTAILMSDRSASPNTDGLPKIGYVQGKISVVYDVFARFRTDIADVKETIIYYEMPE